jgi:hypothetical protein
MTSARYEITVDGHPRSNRDDKAIAIEGWSNAKRPRTRMSCAGGCPRSRCHSIGPYLCASQAPLECRLGFVPWRRRPAFAGAHHRLK